MAAKKKASSTQVFSGPKYTTPKVRVMFPELFEEGTYEGKKIGYSVTVDLTQLPELRDRLEAEAQACIKAGKEKFETTKSPGNEIFKVGEYDDTPYERVVFKMRGTRKVKGTEIAQRPTVVDAKRLPMTEDVGSGSECRIAYHWQFSITPTGCFITAKLDAVQVIEHVGRGGQVSINSLFDEEEGYEADVSAPASDAVAADESEEVGEEESAEEPAPKKGKKSGRDF